MSFLSLNLWTMPGLQIVAWPHQAYSLTPPIAEPLLESWREVRVRAQKAVAVYADGGLIGSKNPSRFGVTWTFALVNASGERIGAMTGWLAAPAHLKGMDDDAPRTLRLGNNMAELLALLLALSSLPIDWRGPVFSDSRNALGALFHGYKATYANNDMRWAMNALNLHRFRPTLLDGHPTRKHLTAGRGKRGNPVSEHNVYCDKTCGWVSYLVQSGQCPEGGPAPCTPTILTR